MDRIHTIYRMVWAGTPTKGLILVILSIMSILNRSRYCRARPGNGGGLHDYNGAAIVRNCILWNNDSVNYDTDEICNRENSTTVTYSDVKGGWSEIQNGESLTLRVKDRCGMRKPPLFSIPHSAFSIVRSASRSKLGYA